MKIDDVLALRLGWPKLKSCSCVVASCILLAAIVGGCKRSDEEGSSPLPSDERARPQYFKTQFQDESQYIVETIATDLAEQVYYAKNHRLPAPGKFSVHAVEQAGSQFRHPIYDLAVDYGEGRAPLHQMLDIDGPIWGPECYRGLTSALAGEVGLARPAPAAVNGNTALLQALTDGAARTIEVENQEVSKALAANFTDPALHEKAALIIGAFALRDCAGPFSDLRAPLCRMTSHLCMSQFLEGGGEAGIDGRIAGIMLLKIMNDETAALTAMEGLKIDDPAVRAWVRALRARATTDYREIAAQKSATPIERQAWFLASSIAADPNGAWNSLSATEKTTPDFIRIGNEFARSVDAGHQFLDLALRAEISEIGSIYQLSRGKQLTSQEFVSALNETPGRCFSTGADGAVEVDVIGWGQWATFFQRHLCNAVTQNFDFMQWRWSVPDDAAKFRAQVDSAFDGLRLYPFVRRFDSTETAYYRSAVDDGFKVTVETPQLVPSLCWNYLCYKPTFTDLYGPVPNPHINEWHKHNPPPGTVYGIYPRLNHPSLINRPDSGEVLAGLHAQAPYDWYLAYYILGRTNNGHPTAEQASAMLRELLPFHCEAMAFVAQTETGDPARYEQLMTRAAGINPQFYISLGRYFDARQDTEKTAEYYQKVTQLADAVSGANCSLWLVHYYLQKGDNASAKAVADNGGDVYSYTGLQAKADYLEATGDYDGALEWYQKLADRYGDAGGPLIGYYVRYKNRTGDAKYDPQLQAALGDTFPAGIETAAIGSFAGPPADGVRIASDSVLLEASGMHVGDIIVAVSGVRVHNFRQYSCALDFSPDETLDLIEWRGGAYREIKVSVACHEFGADFRDYSL